MKRRGLGAAALISGLAVVVIAQRLAPIPGPPLYDGVVVEDPYVWLAPPPGLHGGAQSAQESDPVSGVGFGVGTPEQPPQAQVIADLGSLDLPNGSTSINVSIKPVAPPAVQPQDGVIAGNVYRIGVTNQSGATIGVASDGRVTMLLRGPASLPSATIELFSGGTWTDLDTQSAGVPDMYTTLLSSFGDYALVAPSGWVPDGAKAAPATPTPSAAPPTPVSASLDAGAVSPGIATAPESVAATAAAPAPPTGSTSDVAPPGSSTGGGLPWSQIGISAIGLLVVIAAGVVMMRPVKPPPD